MQQTSSHAYHKIKENGLLKGLQFEVYEILYHHGPLTQGELWERFYKEKEVHEHSIRPRFTELNQKAVIQASGTKLIESTGMKQVLWEVVDQVPIKVDPRVSHVEKMRKQIKSLERESYLLKALLIRNEIDFQSELEAPEDNPTIIADPGKQGELFENPQPRGNYWDE